MEKEPEKTKDNNNKNRELISPLSRMRNGCFLNPCKKVFMNKFVISSGFSVGIRRNIFLNPMKTIRSNLWRGC